MMQALYPIAMPKDNGTLLKGGENRKLLKSAGYRVSANGLSVAAHQLSSR